MLQLLRILFQVSSPPRMIQLRQIVFGGDQIQVLSQIEEFVIILTLGRCILERFDPKPILWIHDEISSQVVEHDCILGIVEFAKETPNHLEGLAIEYSILGRLNGDHSPIVKERRYLVISMTQDA